MTATLFDFDPRTHARTGDKATSHHAALNADKLTARHAKEIYLTMREYGPLTSEEISERCSLTHPQVWRRMNDLKEWGLIKASDTGIRINDLRLNSSGREATVWVIT